MNRLLLILPALLFTLLVPLTASARAAGPLEVFDGYVAALNAGDAAAAGSFFADDAVLTISPQPPGLTASGKQQIGQILEASVAGKLAIDVRGGSTVSGNRLTRREYHTAGALLPPGFGIEILIDATVQNEKIQYLTITIPPDQLALWQQATQSSQPGMPRTGTGARPGWWLLLVALLCCGIGVCLRRLRTVA